MVGPQTRIGEWAVVSGSVLGERVVVGDRASLSQCHVFSECHIGANCRLDRCILGEGVKVDDGCTIKEGCLLEDGVAIGPGVTLEPFSRVSLSRFEKDDDDESDEEEEDTRGDAWQANLGSGSRGYLWRPASFKEEEGGNDLERFENLQHLRLGADGAGLDVSDGGSNSEESDVGGSSDGGTGRDRRMSNESTVIGREGEFRHECLQSLQRAFTKNISVSVENTAIELKTTIRMTYNVPLKSVSELAIGFLVDQIPVVGVEVKSQRERIASLVGRWGGLITSIGGTTGAETVGILQVCLSVEGGTVTKEKSRNTARRKIRRFCRCLERSWLRCTTKTWWTKTTYGSGTRVDSPVGEEKGWHDADKWGR